MLKTGKVICPTCGGEVVEFDNLDIEVDNTTVTLFKVGECDHCGNHYQWHEDYTLEGYRDLEQTHDESEDEPDDIDDDFGFDPYLGCYTDDC
jgi:YgiT-type zinc finger domain-containing protein